MREKLTLADAMKYPNAGIKNDSREYPNLVSFIDSNIKVDLSTPLVNAWLDGYQLVLRSIDQLTGDEKEDISKFIIDEDDNFWWRWDGTFSQILEICPLENITVLIDYLRSRNIDIDGYIENGKAVKG